MKNLCSGTHRGGFQFLLILDLWGISFHAVIVFGLGKNLLFKSVLGQCEIASFFIHNFYPIFYFWNEIVCKKEFLFQVEIKKMCYWNCWLCLTNARFISKCSNWGRILKLSSWRYGCRQTLDVYSLLAIWMWQIQSKLIYIFCNLWTGQFVSYKSAIKFWFNLAKQNSKKVNKHPKLRRCRHKSKRIWSLSVLLVLKNYQIDWLF